MHDSSSAPSARPRRRSRQPVKRSRTVRFDLSDEEFAEVGAAAARAGMAKGAYAAHPAPGPDAAPADPAVPAARAGIRQPPEAADPLVPVAGDVDRRPGPPVPALVVAGDDAGDQLCGPARTSALRAPDHRQHGRSDAAGRPAPEGQVWLVSGPDHRPPRHRGDHHHPQRPVREHRPAPRPGWPAACLQPRGHRRSRLHVPVEPAAGL